MRTIKFRCYDSELKCWISNLCMKRNNVVTDGTEKGRLKVMQFTGLHDKNGKEIYEGDIVVKDGYIWFDDGEPNYRGTVEWIFSQWQVVAHCVNKDKRGISDGINEGINDDGVDDGENTRWIVLGNVHENPELI